MGCTDISRLPRILQIHQNLLFFTRFVFILKINTTENKYTTIIYIIDIYLLSYVGKGTHQGHQKGVLSNLVED